MSEIHEIARGLVAPGKGILAADESSGTIKKRFDKRGITDSPEMHRKYRQMLFTTPGIEEFISGVIMYDETIRQSTDPSEAEASGKPFPELLEEKGIIPGIKVDTGKRDMPGFEDEKVTMGIDDLPERLEEYKSMGAKFTKWRAVINITDDTPTETSVHANSELLARYAAVVQSVGMVPIVEPEVLMDGVHTLSKSREVTYSVLKTVFGELSSHRVDFAGMLLKPNMVHPGEDSPDKATAKEIAKATVEVLREVVPPEVPGIVFLSGGQSPSEAEENLREMNRLAETPWELSFSYGRALQEPAMDAWGGKDENEAEAQRIFYETAKRDSMAREGK